MMRGIVEEGICTVVGVDALKGCMVVMIVLETENFTKRTVGWNEKRRFEVRDLGMGFRPRFVF